MTIGFEFCYREKMYFTYCEKNGTTSNSNPVVMNLDEAIYSVRSLMETHSNIEQIVCWSAYTGEILFIARAHDDDCVEEVDDCDYDCGFDPYLGCFTDDC